MALDPYFGSVSLLLHCDGANTSTSFIDSSSVPVGVSKLSSTAISTAQSMFGGSSLSSLNIDSGLSVPAAVLNFGTGDYTIEAWFYRTSMSTDAYIVQQYAGYPSNVGCILQTLSTGAINYRAGNNVPINISSVSGLVVVSRWYHIAVTCSAGQTKVFLDGSVVASTSVTANIASTATSYIAITFIGYMDEMRVTKGVARYTSNFAVPTEAFGVAGDTVGSAAINLPSISEYSFSTGGLATVSVSVPSVQSKSIGGGNAVAGLPKLEVVAYESRICIAKLVTPAFTVRAVGHDSTGERSVDAVLPSLSVNFRTGANSDMAMPSLQSTLAGTSTIFGSVRASVPPLISLSSGTVAAAAGAALALPAFSSKSYAGAVCSITVGSLTSSAAGTTGAIGSARVMLPLFEAVMSATVQNHGSAAITLPSLNMSTGAKANISLGSLTLTAIGSATITATYEAYAINLNHTPKPGVEPVDEATRYTNYPFTHVVRYQNSYFGVAADGLYLLEGTTDAGAPIVFDARTAVTDFKSPMQKTVASAYFAGRLGPDATVTLHAGEGAQTQPYSYATPRGALAQNHRQAFGKGIKAHRYYALEVAGSGEFSLDTIELDTHEMKRRI